MNAIEFIQQYGVDKARKHYQDIREAANQVSFVHACEPFASQLKRLVESVDLVNDHGGLETIKKCVEKTIFPLSDRIIRMKKAIADYEAIYEI